MFLFWGSIIWFLKGLHVFRLHFFLKGNKPIPQLQPFVFKMYTKSIYFPTKYLMVFLRFFMAQRKIDQPVRPHQWRLVAYLISYVVVVVVYQISDHQKTDQTGSCMKANVCSSKLDPSHPPYSAKGPWNKSSNFIFPIKYVIPKSLSRLAIGWVKYPSKLAWIGLVFLHMFQHLFFKLFGLGLCLCNKPGADQKKHLQHTELGH